MANGKSKSGRKKDTSGRTTTTMMVQRINWDLPNCRITLLPISGVPFLAPKLYGEKLQFSCSATHAKTAAKKDTPSRPGHPLASGWVDSTFVQFPVIMPSNWPCEAKIFPCPLSRGKWHMQNTGKISISIYIYRFPYTGTGTRSELNWKVRREGVPKGTRGGWEAKALQWNFLKKQDFTKNINKW